MKRPNIRKAVRNPFVIVAIYFVCIFASVPVIAFVSPIVKALVSRAQDAGESVGRMIWTEKASKR